MDLSNKTIVVTGASSGIGAEVARLCRLSGATVFGMDRNDPLITLDGFVKVDLGEPAAIDAAVADLPPRIDGLVNAAGVPGTASRELVARINYLGLRHLTEAALDRFSPGASIVNFASVLGGEWMQRLDLHTQLASVAGFRRGENWLAEHPVPQQTCYQYFKEALIVWTFKQAQPWYLTRNIRMNCVAPGPVFTPILGDFVTMLGGERVAADAPRMKRPGYGDEIAPPVAFLLSDAARWVNGVNLPIDGGLASTYV